MKPLRFILIPATIVLLQFLLIDSASGHCGPFEFTCSSDGACISEELVCDGKADCGYRTDENESFCKKIRCPNYSFRCAYGACIDSKKVCDGHKDCLDGSDELITNCKEEEENEFVGCPIDQHKCRSGECIELHQVCDGKAHCPDQSDEEEGICLPRKCPANAFKCRYGACVMKNARCSGEPLCLDGSDEDELLCGSTYDINNLIRANATGAVLPGSCRVPRRDDLRFVMPLFNTEFLPHSYANDGDLVEVTCKGPKAMNVSKDFEAMNTCIDTKWEKNWTLFPPCQTVCSGADISGRTIKADCEFNGDLVNCDQPQQVGTVARIKCGPYYDMPKNIAYYSQKLTCLSTGAWDKVAIRCTPRCGRVTQAATAYVINGRKAKNIAEVPWVAAIYKRDYVICSGTILSEKLVVSAAHCFFREQAGLAQSVTLEDLPLFKIAVGKYYRDLKSEEMFSPQLFDVSEVIHDPGYDGFNGFFSADFIVLVLDGYIVFRPHVVPICVDLETDSDEYYNVEPGLNGTVAGWGFTSAGGNASDVLKIAKLPTVDYGKCKKESPQNYKQFVTPDKFCAGNIGGGDAVCQGDSGAGLVFPKMVDNNEIYYIRGLVSNARQTAGGCDLNFYTMFTNIHLYMRYIKAAFKKYPSS